MNERKHSGMGIASFITSVACAVVTFALIVVAGVMEASTPGGMDEKSAAAVAVGLGLLASLGVCLIALGLGVAGMLQRDRKKIFAVLGAIIAAAIVLGTVGLMVIGSLAQ